MNNEDVLALEAVIRRLQSLARAERALKDAKIRGATNEEIAEAARAVEDALEALDSGDFGGE